MSEDLAARVRRGRPVTRARSAPKRERVTRGLRAAIVRGDYLDGFALSQDKLQRLRNEIELVTRYASRMPDS
jgi:hypothetical protein